MSALNRKSNQNRVENNFGSMIKKGPLALLLNNESQTDDI